MSQNFSKKYIVNMCESKLVSEWKKIMKETLEKAQINGILAFYYKDYKDQHICRNFYNAIAVDAQSTFKEHAIE